MISLRRFQVMILPAHASRSLNISSSTKSSTRLSQQMDGEVSKLRERLNAYAASVNNVRDACGLSAYQLFAALTRLRNVKTRTRWVGKSIADFTAERYREARDLILEASDSPELFL